MKTMGLNRLVLVNPNCFPDAEASARATGAVDLLEKAEVCASLDEALRGTIFVAAVSARVREIGPPSLTARRAAGELVERSQSGEVALVFGTESSGLSNEEVMRCDRLVTIPTDADFSSLNLASAVQLLSYELRLAGLGDILPPPVVTPFSSPLATREEIEGFFGHLERVMIESRFMDPAQPKRLLPKLRRLFSRTQLEKDEVNILRGLLAAAFSSQNTRPGAGRGVSAPVNVQGDDN